MPSKKNKTSSSTSGQNISTVEGIQPANRFDILGEIDDMSDDSMNIYTSSDGTTESSVVDGDNNTISKKNNNKNGDNDGFQSVNYNRGKSKKIPKKYININQNNDIDVKLDTSSTTDKHPIKPINRSVNNKISDGVHLNDSKESHSISMNKIIDKKNDIKSIKLIKKLVGKSDGEIDRKVGKSDGEIDRKVVNIFDDDIDNKTKIKHENDHKSFIEINDVKDVKMDIMDNESSNNKFVPEESSDNVIKKGIYVPPTVSENNWITNGNQRRKREKMGIDEDDTKDTLPQYDPNIKLPGDDMKLNTTWIVWIHENDNQDWSLKSYKSIYEIDSIGSMWRFLHVLDNLDKNARQYYIMRNGITPIWEDNNNKQGAICSIMIDNMNKFSSHSRGDLGVDAFSAICILVLNESFVRNNNVINGLCYSIKSRSVLIKLWIKEFESNKKFRETLPITILKHIDTILSNMDNNKNHSVRNNGKSGISVQLKAIKPNY